MKYVYEKVHVIWARSHDIILRFKGKGYEIKEFFFSFVSVCYL